MKTYLENIQDGWKFLNSIPIKRNHVEVFKAILMELGKFIEEYQKYSDEQFEKLASPAKNEAGEITLDLDPDAKMLFHERMARFSHEKLSHLKRIPLKRNSLALPLWVWILLEPFVE